MSSWRLDPAPGSQLQRVSAQSRWTSGACPTSIGRADARRVGRRAAGGQGLPARFPRAADGPASDGCRTPSSSTIGSKIAATASTRARPGSPVVVLDRHLDRLRFGPSGATPARETSIRSLGIADPVDAKRSIRDQLSEVERHQPGELELGASSRSAGSARARGGRTGCTSARRPLAATTSAYHRSRSGIPGRLDARDGLRQCAARTLRVHRPSSLRAALATSAVVSTPFGGSARPDRIAADLREELRLLGRHASTCRPADDAEQLVGTGRVPAAVEIDA